MSEGDFTRYYATDLMHDKTGALQVQQAYLSITAGTNDQAVINAVAGKAIRVLGVHISNLGAGNVKLKSGTGGGGYAITHITAGDGDKLHLELNPLGWMESAVGVGIYSDAYAANYYGVVRYVLVTY